MAKSSIFTRQNKTTWTGESAHYTVSIHQFGGYWMQLTHKTTGVESMRFFGRTLAVCAETLQSIEAKAAKETPCAWMDAIEAQQEVWEVA